MKTRYIREQSINPKKKTIITQKKDIIQKKDVELVSNDIVDFNSLSPNHLFIFKCPNCLCFTEVLKKEIRCTIFRHAAWVKDMKPVPPHSTQINLELWKKTGKIWGCAKPFKLIVSSTGIKPIKCGYI